MLMFPKSSKSIGFWILWNACQICTIVVSTPTGTSGCDELCTDYHRICPVLTNPSYQAKLSEPGVAEYLSQEALPSPVECSNPLYAVLCPLSCSACVACKASDDQEIAAKIESLASEIAQLEQENAAKYDALTAELTQLGQDNAAEVTSLTNEFAQLQQSVDEIKAAQEAAPVTQAPTPTRITIAAATSDVCLNNDADNWGVQKAYDQKADTTAHSNAGSGGWASFYIPKSIVTTVRMQNRKDCCGERMTGNVVYVCQDAYCSKCGSFPPVGNGQWGTMECSGGEGFEGSYVKIIAPSSYLQIAEIEIYGIRENRISEMQITGVTSSPIYNGDHPTGHSYDNNWGTFYHSKDASNQYIKYQITGANVRYVAMLNRPDCCDERMTGNIVYVCTDENDASCVECGAYGRVGKKQWGVTECGSDGIHGQYVKILSPSAYLQVTEVDIFANVG